MKGCKLHHLEYSDGEVCPKCKEKRDRIKLERVVRNIEFHSIFKKLLDAINVLSIDIKAMNTIMQQKSLEAPTVNYNFDLLALPDHIRKTVIVAMQRQQVTAEDVALVTKRARAVESSYLNQLVTMGWMIKERHGRKALFSIKGEWDENLG